MGIRKTILLTAMTLDPFINKYINGRMGKRSIGAIHSANNIVDTDKEKAFADNGQLPFITNNHNHKDMEDIIIMESDVYMSIKRLENKITCRPEGLPSIYTV